MRRGGGRKVRALPRKFVFLGFGREEPGMSQEFRRDVPDPWGCSKSLCKKSSCAFFGPYFGHFWLLESSQASEAENPPRKNSSESKCHLRVVIFFGVTLIFFSLHFYFACFFAFQGIPEKKISVCKKDRGLFKGGNGGGGFHTPVRGTVFVRDGVVTPGPSRKCDIHHLC